ncbi:glycosyltransferase, partial [Pelagibacteraceae bacterium]|nr:glycosyltransferase [Pelagibacteraceae bacterium]
MKISYILTTLNEEKHIEKIINEIDSLNDDYEIIIIDDSTSDKTLYLINKFKNSKIKVYIRDFNSGLGSAIVSGIFHTTGELICWLDVSMDYHVKNIVNASKKIGENDIILFSRYIIGGGDKRSLKRKLPSKIINSFCRLILTKKITDYTGGLFILKRNILKNILPVGIGHGNYFIDFIYRCYVNKLIIKQLPIVYEKEILEEKSKTFKNLRSFLIL